jgi:putative ABC transport system substrate-binding protein
MTTRRTVLTALLACGLVPGARAAREGPKKIGILTPTPAQVVLAQMIPQTYAALKALGFVQGRDVTIVWRSAELDDRKLPALARELVAEGVDVLLVDGTPATHAARDATATVPIVTGLGDPIRSGFAKSIAHPGGNVTGLSIGSLDTNRRLIEVLRSLYPKLGELFLFYRPASRPEVVELMVDAARDMGVASRKVVVKELADVNAAFDAMRKRSGSAGLTLNYLAPVDPQVIVDLGIRHRIPIVSTDQDLTAGGGLASFSLYHRDDVGRKAALIAKILRGANPADIPFELPDAYELTINRTTVALLGLQIPPDLLVRATDLVD